MKRRKGKRRKGKRRKKKKKKRRRRRRRRRRKKKQKKKRKKKKKLLLCHYPTALPCGSRERRGVCHIVRRIFLFPVDISLYPVLSAIGSQLFPPHDHF